MSKKADLKLQHLLSLARLGSRRKMEEAIADGQVKVNGQKAHLGQRVGLKDSVSFRGKRVQFDWQNHLTQTHQSPQIIAFHKPIGLVCSTKSEKDALSVFSEVKLPKDERWIMVGRLDIQTSGVLLFTNSGDLAHQLTHPRFQIERSYKVRVFGRFDEAKVNALKEGVMDRGDYLKPQTVRWLPHTHSSTTTKTNHFFEVVLTEGKNREIHRLFEAFDAKVNRLIRTQFASISVDLIPKQKQQLRLNQFQVKTLRTLITSKLTEIKASDLEAEGK